MDKKTLRRENESLRQESADLSAKYDALLRVVRLQGERAALGDRSTSIAVSADGGTLEIVRHAEGGIGGALEKAEKEYAALLKLQQKEKECVEAMQTLMEYTEEHIAEMAELVAEQRWGELEDCVARWEDAGGK